MSLKRNNPKRDSTEPQIVKAFRDLGCRVWRLDQPADLLIATPRQRDCRSSFFLVECKSAAKASLTPVQQIFHEDAYVQEWPVYILHSEAQVLEFYNLHCKRYHA